MLGNCKNNSHIGFHMDSRTWAVSCFESNSRWTIIAKGACCTMSLTPFMLSFISASSSFGSQCQLRERSVTWRQCYQVMKSHSGWPKLENSFWLAYWASSRWCFTLLAKMSNGSSVYGSIRCVREPRFTSPFRRDEIFAAVGETTASFEFVVIVIKKIRISLKQVMAEQKQS